MFVARIYGDTMEPTIPAGSYCLFRQADKKPYDDEVLLVSHGKITDPHLSGNLAVRRVESAGQVGETDEWAHERLLIKTDNRDYPDQALDLAAGSDLEILGVVRTSSQLISNSATN